MYLICDYKEQFWMYGGIIYTCVVKTPNITEPLTEVEGICGYHQDGKSNEDVKGLAFDSITVNFIPQSLGVFFPNLTHLDIDNCGLKSICREDLSQFPLLELLWITSNQLTTLPDDLFNDTKNLKSISFKPIIDNEFEYITFERNTKIDAFYEPSGTGTVASVADLMKVIDTNCSNPSAALQYQSAFEFETTHHRNSSTAIEALFNVGQVSDFSIVVNDSKIFKVHKCIVGARSQEFSEMFSQYPNATEMKIEDLSAEAVEIFLCFFYTGKLEDFDDKSLELFALASKLKVPDLRESMLKLVVSQLDDSNAFKAFSLAHSMGSDELKRAAFKAIKKMFPERKLPESLMENLEQVREMIIAKGNIDAMVKAMEKFEVK
jgi:hypothetical protein